MATTTPNFGFDIPQSTDLVKDGATAIAALGTDIDTAFVDLKGGTTGQVLAKASGTDLDFSWVAQDDSNAIQNAIVDAKGDLIAATAADTPARLAVGTNGQILTADSTASTGIKWATPAASGRTLINTGGTALTGSSTTVSSIPGTYTDLIVVITGWQTGSDSYHYLYCNADQTAGNYQATALRSYSGGSAELRGGSLTDSMGSGTKSSGNSTGMCVVTIPNYANAFRKNLQYNAVYNFDISTGVNGSIISNVGWNASAAITDLTWKTTAGTYSAGTIYVYGVN